MNIPVLTIKDLKNHLLKNEPFDIVFLGDSLTSAEWVHPNWREIVEYVLKEEMGKIIDDWKIPEWNIRGINSGFDGATTRDLLDRLESAVFRYNPKMVICIIGSTEMELGINISQAKKDTIELFKKITAKVPYFVYCTSLPSTNKKYIENYSKYAKAIKTLLPYPKVSFVNIFERCQQYDLNRFFSFISLYGVATTGIKPGDPDYIHPNHLGNAYMAKVILEDVFGIGFEPELYSVESARGQMFPRY